MAAQHTDAEKTQTVTLHQEGPLPTPADLRGYEQLLKGAANRIITMAESEQAHRLRIEVIVVEADIRHRDDLVESQRQAARGSFRSDLVGQVAGWSVAMMALGGAIYNSSIHGDWRISVALVSLPVAAIIKAFLVKKPPST